jgi:hypothetical protein
MVQNGMVPPSGRGGPDGRQHTNFGYQIVDELLAAMIAAQRVIPLRGAADPLQVIAAEFEKARTALEHGQRSGVIRADIDTASSAHALVAQIEGILSLARNSQDPGDLTIGARGLRTHLESLRAAG